MSRGGLVFGAIALLVVAFLISSTFFVVNQAEQVLVLRFGQVRQSLTDPGLHMKAPFIDDVVRYDARLLAVDPPPEEVILGDQKRIVVDTYTRYRIDNPLLFYQAVRNEDGVRARVREIVNNALRKVLGNVMLPSVLSPDRENIMRQIQQEVTEAAKPLGIAVVDVRIRRADLPPETSQAIFRRMQSERQREAAEARAEGQEKAQEIRASAERERTVILAEAQKQSEILRGDGDAESTRVFAEAASQAPQFFVFYRSMQAYRHSLGAGDTTYLLTPNSDFLKFFGKAPVPAGGESRSHAPTTPLEDAGMLNHIFAISARVPSRAAPADPIQPGDHPVTSIRPLSPKTLRALPQFVVALVAGLGLMWSVAAHASGGPGPDGFAELAARLLPAVVNVSTTQTIKKENIPDLPQFPPGSPFDEFFKDFMERQKGQDNVPRKVTALGSGFIIDPSGLIVTNNHVIDDADQITVILHDEQAFKAKIVGRDTKADLALLKIDAPNKLPFVPLGNSDTARVGDWVIAIGNPFGLGGTVTAGIVSARARDINAGPYDDFIQTDAAINKGNSGGPLFNMRGEVVGINTAIFSPSGGSIGIGFSIPSNEAKPVLADLQKYGKTRRGWLGVRIQSVTPDIADSLGLKEQKGALIAGVTPNGPAEKAGIKTGDVIQTFDGKPVEDMRHLPRIVAETDIDKEVAVQLWRDGKSLTIKAKVGELPEEEQTAEDKKGDKEQKSNKADAGQAEISGTRILGRRDQPGAARTL